MSKLEELKQRKNDLEKQIKQLSKSLRKTKEDIEAEISRTSLNLVGKYLKEGFNSREYYFYVESQKYNEITKYIELKGLGVVSENGRRVQIWEGETKYSEPLDSSSITNINDFSQLFPGWVIITEEEFKEAMTEVIEKASDFVKAL